MAKSVYNTSFTAITEEEFEWASPTIRAQIHSSVADAIVKLCMREPLAVDWRAFEQMLTAYNTLLPLVKPENIVAPVEKRAEELIIETVVKLEPIAPERPSYARAASQTTGFATGSVLSGRNQQDRSVNKSIRITRTTSDNNMRPRPQYQRNEPQCACGASRGRHPQCKDCYDKAIKLQPKCACGNHIGLNGKCRDCARYNQPRVNDIIRRELTNYTPEVMPARVDHNAMNKELNAAQVCHKCFDAFTGAACKNCS